jgi:hypothetical protein
MNRKPFISLADRLALIAGLCLLAAPVVAATAQARGSGGCLTVAVSSANPELPKGLKVIARIPLQGQPITRMYTGSEYGHSYLYLEHGQEPATSVDVSKKRTPHIVDHQPGRTEPAQYEQLAEGGTIRVSPLFTVNQGFDNQGVHGMLSILESSNSEDAKLLQAFGPGYSNLADRDRRLVFFASPLQVVVIEDNRLEATGY